MSGRSPTIKALVLDVIHRTRGRVDYAAIEKAVLGDFPESAFKKTHWTWYRYQCLKGRFSHLCSAREKKNLVQSGRMARATSLHGRRGKNASGGARPQAIPITRAMLAAVKMVVGGSLAYEKVSGGTRKVGITGEVGEVLACHSMGLRLCVDPRSPGVDAIDRKGRRVQIKTRRSESGGLPSDAGRIGTFSRHPFGYALLVILDRKYRLVEIWKAERKRIWPLISRLKRRNPNLASFKRKATRVWPPISKGAGDGVRGSRTE